MAKTKLKVDVTKLTEVSTKLLKDLEAKNPLATRYEGEFTMIREAKSGSVQLALTSWDGAGDTDVKKLMDQGEEGLLFHVSKLEYEALKADNMTSKFFIRNNQNGTRMYIGLDNETSNTRKENGISVSAMSKMFKPEPKSIYAKQMAQRIAIFKSGQFSGNLQSIQNLITAQGSRTVTAE